MLKKLIVLIIALTTTQAYSADLVQKIGINKSWFANEGGTSKAMPAFGIGVHFPLDDKQVVKICVDAMYVGQKMV